MEAKFKQNIRILNDNKEEKEEAKFIVEKYSLIDLIGKVKSQDEIDKKRKNQTISYYFEDIKTPLLPGEQWLPYWSSENKNTSGWIEKYKEVKSIDASNLGRVRFFNLENEKQIKPQIEYYTQRKGYLCLEGKYTQLPNDLVYQIIANVWLEEYQESKPDGLNRRDEDKCPWAVHHISNDGYDNRPENLIWLKWCDHACVHPFMINFNIPSVCRKCSVSQELKHILGKYKSEKNIRTINDLPDWSIFLIDENNFRA
ncbi:MAG: hypothetical protein PHC34_01635 [Candidatus Gastranaerophilales bacterium]|nr:hypothetical protein [Candidatus Gastranaerophilales bacterium]